jgi:hypothetical protein
MIMNMIPEVVFNKTTLQKSTILCDLYNSRLMINKLMALFELGNGKYMRLWHCMEPIYGNKWTPDIERKIQYYKYCKWGLWVR